MAAQGFFVRYQHPPLTGFGVRLNASKKFSYVGPFPNDDRAFAALRQLRDDGRYRNLEVVLRQDRTELPIHIKPDPRTILGPAYYERKRREGLVRL